MTKEGKRIRQRVMHRVTRFVNDLPDRTVGGRTYPDPRKYWWRQIQPYIHEYLTQILEEELK